MKKYLLCGIIALGLLQHAIGQQLMRSYYDWQKTMKKEEYYVNAKGEKNGSYKAYSDNGILALQYNFKNGLMDGLCVEYETSTGRQLNNKSETYKDGILNGPATYYNGNNIIYRQGSFKNAKKEGMWLMVDGADMVIGQSYYKFTNEEQKTCHYIKYNMMYKDDELVYDGKLIMTYYPSGKIYCEVTYSNGKKVGDNISYYPNGKVQVYAKYNPAGVLAYQRNCDAPGCPKDSLAIYMKQWEEKSKANIEEQEKILRKQKEDYKVKIAAADEAFSKKDFENATKLYSDASALMDWKEQYPKDKLSEIDATIKKAQQDVQQKKEAEESALKNRLAETQSILNQKLQQYQKLYIKVEYVLSSTGQTVNDINTGQPVTKESYPCGERLYKKSLLVIQEYVAAYNAAKTLDEVNSTFKKPDLALDKLIQLASHDSKELKELNKKLKEAEKTEDIKSALGI